jgi:regulatory protein
VASVTALRKRTRGRVEIELDGLAWRVVPAEVVVRLSVAVGDQLERPQLRILRRELRRNEALEQATRALRYRDLSSHDLRELLERRGTAPFARDQAVATLETIGLLDDTRFARTRAENLAARGLGDAAIRFALDRQGVPRALADEVLAELEPELDRARRLVAVHGARPRTARLLVRKGFGEDSIEAACAIDVAPDV